jgi:hypothetical protein
MRIYLSCLALLLCPVPCNASPATMLGIAVVVSIVIISAARGLAGNHGSAIIAAAAQPVTRAA